VPGAGAPTSQLIGRAAELAELDGALGRLAAGQPWFVHIATFEPPIKIIRSVRTWAWSRTTSGIADVRPLLPGRRKYIQE
jgi:hypothetical protein